MDAATLPDLDRLDAKALKALIRALHEQVFSHRKQLSTQQEEILSQREQLASRDAEIEHLKLLIAKLRRMQFGRSSEKRDRQIEQLELRLEELQVKRTKEAAAVEESASAGSSAARPIRRPLPDHLPREVRKYSEIRSLPRLWRKAETSWRRCLGNLGVCAGQSQSHPLRSSQAGLRGLRSHRAGRSAEPTDRAKHGWAWASGPRAGIEIL
jgi:Transposase C of IS166 homeodomain